METTPWQEPIELAAVLNEVVASCRKERRARRAHAGYTEAELAAREQVLGRPIPSDIRAFYAALRPERWQPKPQDWGDLGFLPLGETSWHDPDVGQPSIFDLLADECLPDGWKEAEYFLFGYTPFGDQLFWCDHIRGVPRGTILITDHEDDGHVCVLGHSLSQWLARFLACDCVEFSIAPGAIEDGLPYVAVDFAADHLRLNPRAEWAARLLAKQSGTTRDILYWDPEVNRLRRLNEVPTLKSITLSALDAGDLGQITVLQQLEDLMILNCTFHDLSAIGQLRLLKNLYLYDLPDLDLSPLGQVEKLERLVILRTNVCGLSALASLKKLRRLSISGSGLSHIDELVGLRSLEVVELSALPLRDLRPIGTLTNVRHLDLSRTPITDIAPLARLQKLEFLGLADTKVRDLSPLFELRSLRELDVPRGVRKRQLRELAQLNPELEITPDG